MSRITHLRRIALIALSSATLAGCTTFGDGYYDNYGYGYGSAYSGYDCDPYAGFDDYYGCDSAYGYGDIGYRGGWFDNYYYPGYGLYIFDRGGRRFSMRDNHRRYWSGQRGDWYRQHRGEHRGGWNGGNGNGTGYGYGRPRGDGQPGRQWGGRDRSLDRPQRGDATAGQPSDGGRNWGRGRTRGVEIGEPGQGGRPSRWRVPAAGADGVTAPVGDRQGRRGRPDVGPAGAQAPTQQAVPRVPRGIQEGRAERGGGWRGEPRAAPAPRPQAEGVTRSAPRGNGSWGGRGRRQQD